MVVSNQLLYKYTYRMSYDIQYVYLYSSFLETTIKCLLCMKPAVTDTDYFVNLNVIDFRKKFQTSIYVSFRCMLFLRFRR